MWPLPAVPPQALADSDLTPSIFPTWKFTEYSFLSRPSSPSNGPPTRYPTPNSTLQVCLDAFWGFDGRILQQMSALLGGEGSWGILCSPLGLCPWEEDQHPHSMQVVHRLGFGGHVPTAQVNCCKSCSADNALTPKLLEAVREPECCQEYELPPSAVPP